MAAETAAQARISDTTLRGFTGYGMKRAFNAIQTDVNAALAPLGLRMVTFSALVIVVDNPGLRQSQLAEALSIERPNLVLLVDDLERRGLITRDRAPDDGRAYALTATAQGRALYVRALKAVRDHDDKMTRALSDTQRAAMVDALARIEAAGGEGGDPA